MPILFMIEAMIKYQQDKYVERKEMSKTWSNKGKALTEYAELRDLDIAEEASKRKVELVERNHPIYLARVSVTDVAIGYIEVGVNVQTHKGKCPCRYYDEFGVNCSHVHAVLVAIEDDTGMAVNWCHNRYHLDTYKRSYSSTVPPMAVAGKLVPDIRIAPPDFKRSAGRPTKKRKERSAMRKTSTKRECKACGGYGHFHTTCTQPSTQYRFQTHKQKAILWCESVNVILG
jgi:ribosomal protein L32